MTEKELLEQKIPFVVIHSDGKKKVVPLERYGELTVITHQGKVDRVRKEKCEKFGEMEG